MLVRVTASAMLEIIAITDWYDRHRGSTATSFFASLKSQRLPSDKLLDYTRQRPMPALVRKTESTSLTDLSSG